MVVSDFALASLVSLTCNAIDEFDDSTRLSPRQTSKPCHNPRAVNQIRAIRCSRRHWLAPARPSTVTRQWIKHLLPAHGSRHRQLSVASCRPVARALLGTTVGAKALTFSECRLRRPSRSTFSTQQSSVSTGHGVRSLETACERPVEICHAVVPRLQEVVVEG